MTSLPKDVNQKTETKTEEKCAFCNKIMELKGDTWYSVEVWNGEVRVYHEECYPKHLAKIMTDTKKGEKKCMNGR